ncbi:MAG: hypothetical protein ACRDSN_04370 [Pseudonocardiaceae bacterium]
MARPRKPTPIEVFETNVADAERLLSLARALDNKRLRRMRRELREGFGSAMRLSTHGQERLDCVESEDLFVIIKPDGALTRGDLAEQELRPLLRQAIVSVAGATESYVAEKASSYIGDALDGSPDKLRGVRVTLGEVFDIEQTLKRRRFGWRRIVQERIERDAGSAPNKIDAVFGLVGKQVAWGKIDDRRHVRRGESRKQMEGLAKRRNRIAHTGDRVGAKRAVITLAEAESHLTNAKAIVEALEREL